MSTQIRPIAWGSSFEEALRIAREKRRAVALKPLGQGMGECDDW